MKTFQEFREDLSKNTIQLDAEAQKNLNKAMSGQIGPGSKPSPNRKFTLVPVNPTATPSPTFPVTQSKGLMYGKY
jgi:hypothetical protein